jgi:hypothetical protein
MQLYQTFKTINRKKYIIYGRQNFLFKTGGIGKKIMPD